MDAKTILIVDDFEGIILKLKAILEKAGYRVIYSKNGQEAYDIMNKQIIDLVITDVEMPGMNGIKLTKVIRKNEKYTNIPVLVVTKETSYKELSKEAGATGWITKPFNAPKVLEMVRSLL